MEGRRLTRIEVLRWNDSWSFADRQCVAAALDAVSDGVCVLIPSDRYIGVWVGNRRVLTINPGYLSWRGGRWTADLPPVLFPDMHANEQEHWHELSTFHAHSGGPPSQKPAQKCCPIHGLELPATGVCDDCR